MRPSYKKQELKMAYANPPVQFPPPLYTEEDRARGPMTARQLWKILMSLCGRIETQVPGHHDKVVVQGAYQVDFHGLTMAANILIAAGYEILFGICALPSQTEHTNRDLTEMAQCYSAYRQSSVTGPDSGSHIPIASTPGTWRSWARSQLTVGLTIA